MKMYSKETRGFNFKTESNSPTISQQKMKGVPYDFNKIAVHEGSQQNQSYKFDNQSFFKTTDSLRHDSFEIPKQRTLNVGLSQFKNQSKIGGLQTITTRLQKKQAPQNQNLSSQITAEQITYIEELFFSILTQSEQQQLKQLIASNRQISNDRFAKQQTLLFLSLNSLIKQRKNYCVNQSFTSLYQPQLSQNLNKQSNLKKWAIYQLRNRKQFTELASKKNISQYWMLLAQGKTKQLVNYFVAEEDYEQAILASNILDESFKESFQFDSSIIMKKQYNLLQSKDIKITPNVVWPVDFAISIIYFEQSQLQQYVQQIFKKYYNSQQNLSPALEPALLLLALDYSQQKLNEKMVEIMIKKEKRLSYLRHVLFLYALKDHSKKYPKIIKSLTQNLIIQLHNPQLFIQLLMFLKLEQKEITQFLKVYLSKNKIFLQQKQKRLQQLYSSINQKAILSNFEDKEYLPIKILYEWMICQKYINITVQKNYFESLRYYIDNFQQIKSCKTHQNKDMVDLLMKSVIRFQVACTYKEESRRSYYNMLQKLHNLLQTKYEKTIILGCMAYLQLKFNVFWFYQPNKLNNMYQLFLFVKRSYSQNAFIINIRKTLENIFATLQAKIYLTELAAKYDNTKRLEFAESIKKQIKNRKELIQINFGQMQLFKILEMLNWNNKIANLIAIKLLFH